MTLGTESKDSRTCVRTMCLFSHFLSSDDIDAVGQTVERGGALADESAVEVVDVAGTEVGNGLDGADAVGSACDGGDGQLGKTI